MITNEMKQVWARQIAAIAKRAGAFIAGSKIGSVTEKGGSANVVTDIDVKCQQLIVEECLKLLPQSCVLAEEGTQRQAGDGFTWIIDPIDGTTNYLYDYRHSCISIALYHQKKGVVGVVYDPYLDECAAAGKEAFEALIRNERRIELCFEGQRFYDLRRWATSAAPLNGSVSRPVITATQISRSEVEKRSYASQWLPIPYTEKTTMKNMLQNEGWSNWE